MPLTSKGLILSIAGILLLGIGLYFFFYTEFNWIWGNTYPYRMEGVVGMVVGFALLAVAINDMVKTQPAVLPRPALSLQQAHPAATERRFCENCGTALSATAKYCPKCGQKV